MPGHPQKTSAKNSLSRYLFIDQARGFAIVLMFIYHFCFDLDDFDFLKNNFYTDPFWINFRIVIVSLFLSLVGIGLILATRNGINIKRFNKRLFFILAGAAIVSIGSYIEFPNSFIYFGILHFIAAASVVGLLFIRLYYTNLVIGILVIATAFFYSHPVFDNVLLNWIGLVTKKPITEDYVPFFPWFGVVLIGMFIGKAVFVYGHFSGIGKWGLNNWSGHVLSFLGRYSLLAYLIHQPVFYGLLAAFNRVIS